MIERDWNRPSIIMWGVRINESQDDHDFYAETNRVARELDPTRQTGGVRYITDSELLEDVYTMNDFILGSSRNCGGNRPRTALRSAQETPGLDQAGPLS
jgi:beta-galactosidase